MGTLYFPRVSIVTLTALTLFATAPVAQDYTHPGRVVDRYSGTPVVSNVVAWPKSVGNDDGSGCPEYGDAPIDVQISAPDGNFYLTVPTQFSTYTSVYCLDDFFPRIDRYIPNRSDGEPVVPVPARVWPIQGRSAGDVNIENEIVRLLNFALNELAYLQTIAPDEFASAIASYGEAVGAESDSAASALLQIPEVLTMWQN